MDIFRWDIKSRFLITKKEALTPQALCILASKSAHRLQNVEAQKQQRKVRVIEIRTHAPCDSPREPSAPTPILPGGEEKQTSRTKYTETRKQALGSLRM